MAVVYRAYLFDLDGFEEVFIPLTQHLKTGAYRKFQETARQVAERKPDIRNILEDYRIYPDDLGCEDEEFDTVAGRLRFWTMVILSSFLRPLAMPPGYVKGVISYMQHHEESISFSDKLVRGKPIGSLFETLCNLEDSSSDPLSFWNYMGMVGWLDQSDIRGILVCLSSIKEEPLYENEAEIMAFRAAKRMLLEANRCSKGLFFAVLD